MKREFVTCLLVLSALFCGCAPESGDEATAEGADGVVGSAPVTSHPRLWVRQADLPRLQSWATSSNPMYAQGLVPALQGAINIYNTKFYPGGQPNPTWPDTGSSNWEQYPIEPFAEFFAFMSLIDPDPTARAQHATRARNLLMHAMNEAVKGVDTSSTPAPYRSQQFSTYNRANYLGEAYGLIVDWIYPSLTAQDKATIRTVFLRWSSECVVASTAGGEHPQPVGVLNSPQLVANKGALRWAANNYYTGHMRHLTMMSLALDPADDPPVSPSLPVNALGNSMRSYLADVTGAWLYQQYAVYEDPAVSSAALGVPQAGLGVASGGLSVEGFLYGHSIGYLHEALLALHTAGYDDPTLSGPQVALIQSAYWDRYLAGFLSSITPTSSVDPTQTYLGPLYQPASYGDMLRFWITGDHLEAFASMGTLDQITGNTSRLNALRWIAANAIEGGAGMLLNRVANVWNDPSGTQPIFYFLLFDPAAPPPTDPRPALPTTFIDKSFGRVLSRTDWTPQATWFTYLCGWESINHQLGACNQFELYRKGEWLTKERSGYANDGIGMTSDYHNTMAIQNDVPSNLQWFEAETSKRGGQWTNGMNAGDPTVVTSSGAGYVFAAADSTNLYNRPGPGGQGGALDVAHASRSVVYLQPDHVVVYDRATTKTAGRFKRFNLGLMASPTISGHAAQVTSPAGQHLYIQSLLPQNGTLTALAAESFNLVSQGEPTRYRLVVEDTSSPTDTRFLHVLQGADAGVTADATTLLQSTGGTAFQGVAVHGTAVVFPVSASAAFTGTTYAAPASVSTHLITGLAPGAGYTVTTQSTSSGVQVSVSAGGSVLADVAGVVRVSSGSSPPPPPPPPPPTCSLMLGAASAQLAAGGGTGSVGVTAGTGCTWTAASSAAWLTITTGASGSGSGTVGYTAAANTGTSARSATITVGGQTYTVSEAAPGVTCTYALSAASAQIAAGGGAGSVGVTAGSGCAWTAASSAAWLTITAGASGSGNGTVGYTAAANTGTSARSATITVGGQTYTVSEAAPGGTCSPALAATSAQVVAGGGTGTVGVTAGGGCAWTATSNEGWLAVTAGASGSGNGTVGYTAAANTGASARTGTITIGGKAFTVTQASSSTACAVTLPVTSKSFTAAGGTGTLAVSAPPGCPWGGSSSVSWIWLLQPISGTGNGSLGYQVLANTGAARTGAIVVGGQVFTIHQ